MNYKAILLAGGHGTRLYPLTEFSCKQLLPIYDKPLIYYPLTVLLLSGIRDILIISTPEATPLLKKCIGNGEKFGASIDYAIQKKPNGIAEAFLIAESFLSGSPCMLILGDNIINKSRFSEFIISAMKNNRGATIFGFPVKDPERFGIVELDDSLKIVSIIEKPTNPKSNLAVIGLYLYDGTVVDRTKELKPSYREELEITDLNISYFKDEQLDCKILSRGDFWADAGTFNSMNDASNYIRLQQRYTNLLIGAPEEAAYRVGLISSEEYKASIDIHNKKNSYTEHLLNILIHKH